MTRYQSSVFSVLLCDLRGFIEKIHFDTTSTGGEVIKGKFPGACTGIWVQGLPYGSYQWVIVDRISVVRR